jgi:hypothetical protein
MGNRVLRRNGPIVMVTGLAVAGLAAGCSVSDHGPPPGLRRPAETSVPEGTSDPRARPAIQAYQDFVRAAARAQQKPVAAEGDYPQDADFSQYSVDPVVAEYGARVAGLSQAKQEFRGTPPQSHIEVMSIDPDAAPWPAVILSDCQTGRAGWQVFDTRTGRPVADAVPAVPEPFGVTVTVIYSRLRWGVSTITLDSTRTCPD